MLRPRFMPILLAALLPLITVLLFSLATPMRATPAANSSLFLPLLTRPIPGPLLAFNSANYSPSGGGRICTIGSNGVGQRCVDSVGREPAAPRWSPDGTRLLFGTFVVGCPPTQCPEIVYTVNADGSGLRPFTTAISNTSSPFWSPDGRKVALIDRGADGRQQRISILNADGSAPTPAFDPQRFGTPALTREWIAWAPDSSRVAAIFTLGGREQLCLSNDGSGAPYCLDQLENVDSLLDWSPDGTSIAVRTAVVNGAAELYAVPVDGADARKLADCGLGCFSPRWSPDGTRLLFIGGDDGIKPQLTVINADGSGRTTLTPPTQFAVDEASWSPDGTQIVVTARRVFADPQIFLVNPNDGTIMVVVDGIFPSWQP